MKLPEQLPAVDRSASRAAAAQIVAGTSPSGWLDSNNLCSLNPDMCYGIVGSPAALKSYAWT
jgi:hypothetical protein